MGNLTGIDPDKAKELADYLVSEEGGMERINEIAQKFGAVSGAIAECWESPDQKPTSEHIEDVADKLKSMSQNLESIKDWLSGYAQNALDSVHNG